MRIYTLKVTEEPTRAVETELLRSLKPHTSPVVTSTIDQTSSLLATGCADGSIKVWDIKRGYATHTFHGHGGVVSALCFFELGSNSNGRKDSEFKNLKIGLKENDSDQSTTSFRLASGSEDGKIRIWDLYKRKAIATLDSHVSVVRSLSFSDSQQHLLSGSRDKTVIMWDAAIWRVKRTIPVLESVEAAGFLQDGPLCYIGGENGRLRIWDTDRGSEVTMDQEPTSEQEAIVTIQYSRDVKFVLTVHVDQTLKLHSVEPLSSYKPGSKIEPLPIPRHISGNDDEVIDLACLGRDKSLLGLATNSEFVQIGRAHV